MKSSENKYYVCLKGEQQAIPWNLIETERLIVPDCAYFGRVFINMEQHLQRKGIIFYLTWNLNELPAYGKDIVAVVLGDEWCRIPIYTHKILAVFKCYGTHLTLGCNPFLKPSYLNFLSLIQFQKAWLARLPGWLNHKSHKLKSSMGTVASSPIYDIPLGYYKQVDLPIKDIESRDYDIYFAGSLTQKKYSVKSLKYWLGSPKSLSRKKMISSIGKLKQNFPNTQVELSLTQGFHVTSDEDAKSYSNNMMETKICPVPRGTSLETYRFFEAMRYGCIVVTEPLPSRWFYSKSPAIQINDWSELEEVVKPLLENKSLMRRKHQESLSWWKNQCSEAAVGAYIATKLNTLSSDCS